MNSIIKTEKLVKIFQTEEVETIALNGVDIEVKESECTRLRKGRIGFVFQSFNLIDELTVEENVDLQLKYLDVPKAERKERVLDILRLF